MTVILRHNCICKESFADIHERQLQSKGYVSSFTNGNVAFMSPLGIQNKQTLVQSGPYN